jgi:hypothetical protein
MYDWWVLIHIVGVVGFLLAHGVSSWVALRIRGERSPERLRALLDVSASTTVAFYVATLLLLLGGIAAGVDGHLFGAEAWISVSLGVFVAEMGFMLAVTSPYYRRLRRVMAIEQRGGTAVGAAEIEEIVASPVPLVTLWVGTVGLLFIVYLMAIKPF